MRKRARFSKLFCQGMVVGILWSAAVRAETPPAWQRISTGKDGVQTRGRLWSFRASDDGQFVMFIDDGDNLMPGLQREWHLFWKNVRTDTISLISTGKDVIYSGPIFSGTGKQIASLEHAEKTHDLQIRISKIADDGKCESRIATFSADGVPLRASVLRGWASEDKIIFLGMPASSHSNSNGGPQPKGTGEYIGDLNTGKASPLGISLGRDPVADSISDDGRVVIATAEALSNKDTNSSTDIYMFQPDTSGGTIRRISVSKKGIEGNGHSRDAHISRDGRYVAFITEATNLVVTKPGFKGWVVADTTTDEIIPIDEFRPNSFESRFVGFIAGPAVVTQLSASFHVTSLSDGVQKTVTIPEADESKVGIPVISSDGHRLMTMTAAALDTERDTNRNPDVYTLDLGKSLFDIAAAGPVHAEEVKQK